MSQDQHTNNLFELGSVRELIQLLAHTDISELLIERDGSKLHIKRATIAPSSTPSVAPVLSASTLAPLGASHSAHMPADTHTTANTLDIPDGAHVVTSPMVGMFYAAPAPGQEPFVREGDEVQSGDTVGIIEAMKIMNEIECEVSGRVAKFLIQNGQSVEYGQPIMIIEPV